MINRTVVLSLECKKLQTNRVEHDFRDTENIENCQKLTVVLPNYMVDKVIEEYFKHFII